MLLLSRKIDETIVIGDEIVITVVAIKGKQVRLGIEAPTDIPVHREEVMLSIAGAEALVERLHEPESSASDTEL